MNKKSRPVRRAERRLLIKEKLREQAIKVDNNGGKGFRAPGSLKHW